ncbi:hypothetical protein [Chitinimonas sp.]|uniref:hypothetical protein n=1 Tax=Chitinimonas sp. TaxID=1934313 RepID=UPI0035B129F3
MTTPRPKIGRLPAYGKALLDARMAGQPASALGSCVYVHLDCWGLPALPELGKWPLAIKAEDEPAAFDWRLVAGLAVLVVHSDAAPARLQAISTALLAVNPASLHVMNRKAGEYQVVLPYHTMTPHD